jgi:hypothetical protein
MEVPTPPRSGIHSDQTNSTGTMKWKAWQTRACFGSAKQRYWVARPLVSTNLEEGFHRPTQLCPPGLAESGYSPHSSGYSPHSSAGFSPHSSTLEAAAGAAGAAGAAAGTGGGSNGVLTGGGVSGGRGGGRGGGGGQRGASKRKSRVREDGVGRFGAQGAQRKGAGEARIRQLEGGGGVDLQLA